ncbi:MAG: proton-conducting transporter membrane subunit, partial [Pseudomonadota bacterium]
MSLLEFLILFPLIIALFLFFLKGDFLRGILVRVSAIIIGVVTIALFWKMDAGWALLEKISFDKIVLAGDIIICALVIYWGVKAKRWPIPLLMLCQFIPLIAFELANHSSMAVNTQLYIDNFSLIMALIIGIVGGLIAIYALAYMKEFHQHHQEVKDRRPLFFFIIFLFLAAMFGVVFANNLLWLYFFWEVTTICSFVLIGYKQTEESINNAFRALAMNLLGGIGFVAAIIFTYYKLDGTLELSGLLAAGKGLALVPAALLSFAGMTKAAQMPFSSWLLGAMVAPTPVSALLHSSTMVKAGVFLVIKLAPLLEGTRVGLAVAFLGGFTFLMTSFLAIAQADAKKVLAYSTIANLGLIILCAGIGNPAAIWAAIMLVIFHAITKCLLFLCVGSLENKSSSRDIEHMDSLIVRSPMLGWMMLVGMAGMFLAPFGMLVAKWVVIKAILDNQAFFLIFLLFGSAATVFFWGKWMGRIIAIPDQKDHPKFTFFADEKVVLYTLTVMTFIACGIFPLISNYLITPYLKLTQNFTDLNIGQGNLTVMFLMLT